MEELAKALPVHVYEAHQTVRWKTAYIHGLVQERYVIDQYNHGWDL